MSYEYTTDQQCSRSFCSAYWASNGGICESTGSLPNAIAYGITDPNDCGLEIAVTGSVRCSQECSGFSDESSGGEIGTIVGVVVAVLAIIAFVAYRRGWWTSFSCNKNDTSAEDEKEDVTVVDDLEDSQAEGDAASPVESTKTSGDVKQANLQI
jgi:hypothetical protein